MIMGLYDLGVLNFASLPQFICLLKSLAASEILPVYLFKKYCNSAYENTVINYIN